VSDSFSPLNPQPVTPVPSSSPVDVFRPPKLYSIADWVQDRQKTFVLLGIALQLVVLIGVTVQKTLAAHGGQTVLVRTMPVDPRDLLRGDYVRLGYDFNTIPTEGIRGLTPENYVASYKNDWIGRTVYVSLTPDADGRHWRAVKPFSVYKPTSGVFLRGEINHGYRIEFAGIQKFFLEEGKGHVYEDAARRRALSVEMAISPDGEGILRKLHIDETPASIPSAK
jgi:uncharacterized membrane-anchored protein